MCICLCFYVYMVGVWQHKYRSQRTNCKNLLSLGVWTQSNLVLSAFFCWAILPVWIFWNFSCSNSGVSFYEFTDAFHKAPFVNQNKNTVLILTEESWSEAILTVLSLQSNPHCYLLFAECVCSHPKAHRFLICLQLNWHLVCVKGIIFSCL